MSTTIYSVRDNSGVTWFETMDAKTAFRKASILGDATGWQFSVVVAN